MKECLTEEEGEEMNKDSVDFLSQINGNLCCVEFPVLVNRRRQQNNVGDKKGRRVAIVINLNDEKVFLYKLINCLNLLHFITHDNLFTITTNLHLQINDN